MAAVIKRAGKIIIHLLSVIVIICFSSLPTQAKTEQSKLSITKKEQLKQKPVWTENLSQRNSNDRIWEITKWQKKINPKTSEPNVVQVKSLVREKGCGICYRDTNNNWQITDASWRQTATGFVMDKANYALEMGNTADSLLYYDIDGETLSLKADSIKIYDGKNILPFSSVNKAQGCIDPNDKSKLIYPDAFGKGIDLELQTQPDGFHQNVIFRNKLNLPAGIQKDKAKVFLYTELGLDNYLDNSKRNKYSVQMSVDEKGKNIKKKIDKSEISTLAVDKFSKSKIDFVVKEDSSKPFTSHSFVDSKILQYSEKGGLKNLATAEKQIIRGSEGKTYLVESLDCAKMDEAAYPVVWDYHNVSGTIDSNEVWYADATYYVSDDVILDSNVTLKIEPGTIVKFNTGKMIDSTNGTLIAAGAPYEYIIFTSKYDPNAGEVVDSNSLPSAGNWDGLSITENDIVSFCKIGYAMAGIWSHWDGEADASIENNIIYKASDTGIYLTTAYYYADANGAYLIKNNLIDGSSTYGIIVSQINEAPPLNTHINVIDNTVKVCGCGICHVGSNNGSADIKNNLIVNNSPYMPGIIYGTNTTVAHNGFYNSNTAGANYVVCSVNPFDAIRIELGKFFLNNDANGGALLVNAGDGNVADFYDEPNDWSIYPVSDSNHLFTTDTTFTTDKTWQPNYNTCDTGAVAIGYHHPRIDYLLREDITVPTDKTITVKPGTIIAMGGSSLSYHGGIVVFGKLMSEGNPLDGGYIIYTTAPHIGQNWGAYYPRRDCNPSVSFTSSQGGSISFCKFINLSSVDLAYQEYGFLIKNSIFKHNWYGCSNFQNVSNINIINCLFIENDTGIYNFGEEGSCCVINCAFDRNYYGLDSVFGFGGRETLKNNIFTNNVVGINDLLGEYYEEEEIAIVLYNCFYMNSVNYLNGLGTNLSLTNWAYPAVPNAITLNGYPYFTNWSGFSDRFYIVQDSNIINSGDPCDGPMWGYTTDPNEQNIDTNRRDIGYHCPVLSLDADADGLKDYEEYWLGTSPANSDSDYDGLNDYAEAKEYKSNPLAGDTDADEMPDGWEVSNSLNPLVNDANSDADSDGKNNLQEYQAGSDPHKYSILVPSDKTTIQTAINDANNGNEIVVAAGAYYEQINFNGKPITVRSTDPNDPNVVAATIIDANNTSVDVVTFKTTEEPNSVLSGLTVTGGRYGVYCGSSSPLIENCKIFGNNSHGAYIYGNWTPKASPSFAGCKVVNNSGRGIYGYRCGSPQIIDCNISYNNVLGLEFYDNSAAIVSGCLISNNNYGGIYCHDYVDANFTNCVIAKNLGYGIREYRCCGYGYEVYIYNCTIANNTGEGVGRCTEIKNSIIWSNSSAGANYVDKGITFSCIQSTRPGFGNFVANPNFVNVSADNFHLATNSVCVDAGRPWDDYSNEPAPNGGRINIGAYGNTSEATITIDSDSDGMSDAWEQYYFGNLSYDANGNPDGDNFRNISEYLFGYDPNAYTSSSMILAYAEVSPSVFNPAIGQILTITYWLNMDANVTVTCVDSNDANNIWTFEESVLGGMNRVVWDGRDSNKDIFLKSLFNVSVDANDGGSAANCNVGQAELYYDQAISLSCHRTRILPLNNEVSTISFDLAYDANTVVNIYTPQDVLFRTIQVPKDEPNEVVWGGEDSDPNSPNRKYASEEGLYKVEVKLEGMREKQEDSISVYK